MCTVIVTGSHTSGDRKEVFTVLDELRLKLGIDRVVTGGAEYIDTFAIDWAREHKVNHCVEYAEWKRWGKAAGPIRNGVMLRLYRPLYVIAFNGDAGTTDMKRQARERDIAVWDFGNG